MNYIGVFPTIDNLPSYDVPVGAIAYVDSYGGFLEYNGSLWITPSSAINAPATLMQEGLDGVISVVMVTPTFSSYLPNLIPSTQSILNTIVQRDTNGSFASNIITSNIVGNVSGTATNANKLANPMTLSIIGAITGSASFDGSTNVAINTSLTNNYAIAANGGQHIFVQSTQPVALAVGDIWIKTQS